MRVLIVGEEAPGALANSYAAAFRSEGWEVVRYCPRRAFERSIPGANGRFTRRLLRPVAAAAFNRLVARELTRDRADLVFVIKGEHLAPETIERLRAFHGAPVVSFYPDDPFSRVRSNRMTYGANRVLRVYDACFTFARHLVPSYRAAGVERVHHLPFARDPEMHAPPESAVEPEYDVVFAGNLDEERVRWLASLADFRLAIFGEHTRAAIPRESALRRASFHPAAYEGTLPGVLARGRISLNVMRGQNALSHNMRSFESPACGAFSLSQRTPELVELFREGEEIACFGATDEMLEQVRYWLDRPAERRRVAEAGFRRVEHDTYATRVREIVERVAVGGAVHA